MVTMTDSVGRHHDGRRWSPFQVRRAPRITYGKKDTRLLSLTASQFRPDVYAIPSDDESEDQEKSDRNLSQTTVQDAHSDDPRPSTKEPLPSTRTINRRGEVTSRRSRVPQGDLNTKRTVAEPRNGSVKGKDNTVVSVRRLKAKSAHVRRDLGRSNGIADDRHRISKIQQTAKSNARKTPLKTASTPKRRLPVNELVLVNSPPGFNQALEVAEDAGSTRPEDPIEDGSSSARHRASNSEHDHEVGSRPVDAPLSAIRKRLRLPKYRQKSLQRGRNGITETNALANNDFVQRGRDGFEDSELTVQSRYKTKKRASIGKEHLVLKFGCLQLNKGPLPEVEFETATTELKTEQSGLSTSSHPTEHLNYEVSQINGSETTPKYQINIKNRARDDLIRAQLSSISAPERVPSDDEDSDDEDSDDEDDEEPLDDLVHANGHSTDSVLLDEFNETANSSPVVVVESNYGQHHNQSSDYQHDGNTRKTDDGFTLDFRLPLVPGQLPRQPLGKRHLIEVNEAIVEMPESELPPTDNLFYSNHTDQACRGFTTSSTRPQQQRHRSILKNSTPAVRDNTTRRENTTANTRRNTRRNTTVEASESRYFADASVMLDGPDQPLYRIMPRRSSYFVRPEVEVLDSGRVVRQTSPTRAQHFKHIAVQNLTHTSMSSRFSGPQQYRPI